jgi:hypothetical protein
MPERTRPVALVLTEDEYQAFTQWASEKGWSRSQLARTIIRELLAHRGEVTGHQEQKGH